MDTPPISNINKEILLYHATSVEYVDSIIEAVNVKAGRTNLDFGQGFYLTTSASQAENWVQNKFNGNGVVMAFAVDQDVLKKYNGKVFSDAFSPTVTGLTDFVYMNRSGSGKHSYDYVVGQYLINPYKIGGNKNNKPIYVNTTPSEYKFKGQQISIHNHESPDFWAKTIYYEQSNWWKLKEEELTPKKID